MHSSSPPSRKLTQKDPMTAEIRNAAPAQMTGLHNQREQYIRSTAFRIFICGRRCFYFTSFTDLSQ